MLLIKYFSKFGCFSVTFLKSKLELRGPSFLHSFLSSFPYDSLCFSLSSFFHFSSPLFLTFLYFPFFSIVISLPVCLFFFYKEKERKKDRKEEGWMERWRKGETERDHNYSVVNQEHVFLKPDVDHHDYNWKQIFTSLKASSFNIDFHYSSPKSPSSLHTLQGWVELLDIWGHFWEFGNQQKSSDSLLIPIRMLEQRDVFLSWR